jgi:hypothetical protein
MVQRPHAVRRRAENLPLHDAEAKAEHDIQLRILRPLHVLRPEAIDESRTQRRDTEQVGVSEERRHVYQIEGVGAFAAEAPIIGRLVPFPQPVGSSGALPREPVAPRRRRFLLGGVHHHER